MGATNLKFSATKIQIYSWVHNLLKLEFYLLFYLLQQLYSYWELCCCEVLVFPRLFRLRDQVLQHFPTVSSHYQFGVISIITLLSKVGVNKSCSHFFPCLFCLNFSKEYSDVGVKINRIKKQLIELGKAKVTGYCIKFKTPKDINMDILEEAIRYGVGASLR
jgi:Domain of unknown function (DU1801)